MKPIFVIGMSAAGLSSLPQPMLEKIVSADLLVGGRRHLAYFPNFMGETLSITANIEEVAQRLEQALVQDEQAIVLASGDPLFYGIGATLRRFFPAELLQIIPAASAFQLAFAALGEPWHDATLLSAHARPLADVVKGVLSATKAAILTDNQQTPAIIARALLQAGMSPEIACAICENLGAQTQQITKTTLQKIINREFSPLNTLIIWNAPKFKIQNSQLNVHNSPGLPDDSFATSASQITKREIRLLSLAELALGPDQVLWDIGAGSGSVGIEAALAQPTSAVYAIEKRPKFCQHIAENIAHFSASNVYLISGTAPEACQDLPTPHAIFIGGSGGHLATLIEVAQQRLHPDGRLVINLATLENLQIIREKLPSAQVNQIQINRGIPIVDMLRFEALNPIFMVRWQK